MERLMEYTRVIVVGGGFGGLSAAKNLKKAKIDLVLVDKSNHHLFQPLLYQVATATLSPTEITYPIREIFRKQANAKIVMGEVSSIEKEEKKITLANGERLGYDFLVLAPGSRHSYFGEDQWEPLAPGLKTLADALKIREKILLSFEIAEQLKDHKEGKKHLNFIIVGGGPTGVEMAGAVAGIAKEHLLGSFRSIRKEQVQIFLIEALDKILPSYSERLSLKAKKDLTKLGVKVITGKKITHISPDGIHMGDEFIESTNVIWAAGNQASPLLKTLGVPIDKQGRVLVEENLSIPGHPEIFVIGDAACTKGGQDFFLPAAAPVAIQQGKYIAKWINKPNKNHGPFIYKDKGSIATIGKGKACARIGKLEFGGLPAWLAWGFIHILYLVGFRNRLGVLAKWITLFITRQRGAKLILGSIEQPPLS
jgi:NADH:ubiquinone reductase (H+-translocating)